MPGVGQTISKLGTIFEKYVSHSMPIFEKKSHPIRPVEGFKLCLDFLYNTDIFYHIVSIINHTILKLIISNVKNSFISLYQEFMIQWNLVLNQF